MTAVIWQQIGRGDSPDKLAHNLLQERQVFLAPVVILPRESQVFPPCVPHTERRAKIIYRVGWLSISSWKHELHLPEQQADSRTETCFCFVLRQICLLMISLNRRGSLSRPEQVNFRQANKETSNTWRWGTELRAPDCWPTLSWLTLRVDLILQTRNGQVVKTRKKLWETIKD